jgi:hypothetical protein
MENSKET